MSNIYKILFLADIRQKLDVFCKKNFLDFFSNSEYNAVITHWLQNPFSSIPFLNDSVRFRLFEFVIGCSLHDDVIGESYESYQMKFDLGYDDIPFPPPKDPKFTFIDLFAGIGGFRIAFQNLGGKCLFSSEWDKFAKKTYEANFGEVPYGDIKKIDEKSIPKHDILCAGFPCQPFSIAGQRLGFDEVRGTLFFDVARIIGEQKPKAFFLENVKGLKNHKSGQTLKTILSVLRDDLKYFVPEPRVINAKDFGVPQNRERVFIVGFRKDVTTRNFDFPHPVSIKALFKDIKEKDEVSVKYYLSSCYLETLRRHKERHKLKGNGFGYKIISDDEIANAIVVGGMGKERNLVLDTRLKDYTPVTKIHGEVNKLGIRKMTPGEWARLQGYPYPEKFKIVVTDAQAYKQFANSVAVPAIQAVGLNILKVIT